MFLTVSTVFVIKTLFKLFTFKQNFKRVIFLLRLVRIKAKQSQFKLKFIFY